MDLIHVTDEGIVRDKVVDALFDSLYAMEWTGHVRGALEDYIAVFYEGCGHFYPLPIDVMESDEAALFYVSTLGHSLTITALSSRIPQHGEYIHGGFKYLGYIDNNVDSVIVGKTIAHTAMVALMSHMQELVLDKLNEHNSETAVQH